MCALLDEAADEFSVQVVANVTTEQPTTASTLPSETIGVRSSQGVVEVVIRPKDVEASQQLQQD